MCLKFATHSSRIISHLIITCQLKQPIENITWLQDGYIKHKNRYFISDVSCKCLHNLLFKERIHRNYEPTLIYRHIWDCFDKRQEVILCQNLPSWRHQHGSPLTWQMNTLSMFQLCWNQILLQWLSCNGLSIFFLHSGVALIYYLFFELVDWNHASLKFRKTQKVSISQPSYWLIIWATLRDDQVCELQI